MKNVLHTFLRKMLVREYLIIFAGCYPCLMDDFPGRVKYNQWYSLYVLSESVSCIHLVVDECLKVESMLFFTSNYGRNVSLAEFDAAQQHTTTMVFISLRYLLAG